MNIHSLKWINEFLLEALNKSKRSKDPSTKVGAIVIGKDGEPLSNGYNGFPRGVLDLESRYNNREKKYRYVEHAERNAIYNAARTGISLKEGTLFVANLPVCNECAKGIIQCGISHVYVAIPINLEILELWKTSDEITKEMFIETGIHYIQYKYELIDKIISLKEIYNNNRIILE
jgi:dCMP deaminase